MFWNWISQSTLSIITDSSIYHWDVLNSTQENPTKLADRHASLSNCQIIGYSSNSGEKWTALVGIAQENGRIAGHIQLYSKERGISQGIEGHASSFASIRLDGGSSDTQLFTFANRTANGCKLHIVEIDHQDGNPVYQKKAIDLYCPAELPNDFPVSVEVSNKYGVVYVITKYGLIHLYDIETGVCIFMNRISQDSIFTATKYEATSGVLAINRKAMSFLSL